MLRHEPTTRVILLSLTVLTLCLCNCSDGVEELKDEGFSVQTLESGVVRVTHGQLPNLHVGLDTLAVLNVWSDEIEYKFSRVASLMGGDASVVITDGRNLQIVELGLDGQITRVIGGRGGGPGEFQSLQYADRVDGELWAVDVVSRRYSVFSRSGEYLRGYRWPDSLTRHGPFRALGGSRILLRTLDTSVDSQMNVMNLVVLDLQTGDIDTLNSMSAPGYARITLQDDDSPMKQLVQSPPVFSPFLQWALLPGNEVAVAATKDFRIDFVTLEGELNRFLTVASPDLTVTEEDRAWWFKEGFSESQAGRVMDQIGLQPTAESLRTYPFADKRQAVLDLTADPQRRIWVLAATDDRAVNRIDIFSEDGRYLGRIKTGTLPQAFLLDGSPVFEATGPDGLPRYIICGVDLIQ
jgi:hypothetical protein